MHAILDLWRLASLLLGAVALLRLGATPDGRLRHGTRTRVWWTLIVVFGGMGALLPWGPALVCWRTRRAAVPMLPAPVVPLVPFANGHLASASSPPAPAATKAPHPTPATPGGPTSGDDRTSPPATDIEPGL